jgi:hypothetical protein
MKTTKLFFMAALALLMTACSSNDDELTPQPVSNMITVTAKLAPKSSTAQTRALTDDGTNIVVDWAKDETMKIISANGYDATATINNVDGSGVATISFTIDAAAIGQNCLIVYPASAASTTGVLNYASNPALTAQDGTLNINLDVRVGNGEINANNPGTLTVTTEPEAQNAIFKFTLGSAIDATHPLVIKDNTDAVITTVTPTTSTTTAYVAMAPATDKYFKFSATTAEDKVISKSSTASITAGNFYQTTLACPVLGDLYYSDGTYSTTLQTGKTPIGVIAYLGTDNFTENGTTVGGNTFAGHGLVLCLKIAASGAGAQWSTETSTLEFGDEAKVNSADGLKRTTNVSGYTNTKTLAEKTNAATNYKAAYAAKNYTDLTAPTGTTGWFLPSAQQWVKMIEGLGGLSESDIKWNFGNYWFNNDNSAATAWENAMAKAGGKGTAYNSMTDVYFCYFSSSEYSTMYAVELVVDAENNGDGYGLRWNYTNKNITAEKHLVRPVLAF